MPAPFFSVVLPTYNRAQRLGRTLRSVLDQTFDDLEVLVVDDGSTDGSGDMVEQVADPRVAYSWAPNSGGPATPRNRGIEAAKGAWICFVDAGDLWYPDKLRHTFAAISANPSVDAICSDAYEVGGGRRRRLKCGPFGTAVYRTLLLEGNSCLTSGMAVRAAFLDSQGLRFNTAPDYTIVEDYDLWLRMAQAGASFERLDVVLGEYAIDQDGISLRTDEHLRHWEVLLRDHVYHSQTFESDKERLWRRVSIQLQVARMREMVAGSRFGAAVRMALTTFGRAPLFTSLFVMAKVRRRLALR